MRSLIAMERTISTREIFSDWANGGELVPIEVKLFEVANFLAVMCLSLIGCAPNTAHELRTESTEVRTLYVEQNYQAVYRELRTVLKGCYEHGIVFSSSDFRVESELFTDIQQGEMTVGVYGGVIDLHLLVDVFGIEPERTRVEIRSTSYTAWKEISEKVSAFLTDGSPICD